MSQIDQVIPHQVFVVMGVSGSGKSAVGSAVSRALDCGFLDGDFLHPRANIDKMASGQPLNDDDRAPWLGALSTAAYAMQRTQTISVIVCSSLKKAYRDILREGNPNLSFIYLGGTFELIESRLKARQGHFQKPKMLVSQFATLEVPGSDEPDVVHIDIDQSLENVVAAAVQHIRAKTAQE
ncbi:MULTISPECIES: gluconokinase [Iodobacter]|uniref:Gluconokinase n=2 Tax=Iodobacter TaxID=32014 RepID=A0A377Q1U5_9NEIS|nr:MULTISPECIES: gluconokinase [Iodobacter]NHQ85014.1 gluconokinase [Iodobacter violacea]TCU90127.1 gluconate kinase (SKI family) [Iodobacter fluviatilis]STQ89154.1 Thermoresistant gluconokinase [Iodobacter fluviatilis]